MDIKQMNPAQLRVYLLLDRVYKLTGKEFWFENDLVEVGQYLCDVIRNQKKEIGRLEDLQGKSEEKVE